MNYKFPKLFFAFSLVIVFIVLISASHERLALFLEKRASFPLRTLFSYLTSAFGFSLYEVLIVSAPLAAVFAICYVVFSNGRNTGGRFLTVIGCIFSLASIFLITFFVPNRCPEVSEEILNLDYKISNEDVKKSVGFLIEKINEFDNGSLNPPETELLEKEIIGFYVENSDTLGKKAVCFPKIKRLRLSSLFSKAGILALYSPLTGEINVNYDVPDYLIPFSAAHEYAHFIGAGSEADASFIGFLCCFKSNNPYVKYSGMLSALEYLLQDIRKVDKSTYREMLSSLSERAHSDLESWRVYASEYQKTPLYSTSDKLNEAYLYAFDRHGKGSYSKLTLYVTEYITNFSVSA